MNYAIVSVPAAPVRRKPRHTSEMVNQLLFGETVQVLKERGNGWVKARSLHDEYDGWITASMLQEADKEMANLNREYITTDLSGILVINERAMIVPFGSTLPHFSEGQGMIGKVPYGFSGNYIKMDEQQPGPWRTKELTSLWLNAPYLWGGRTVFGIDCSGFVQLIFGMMGVDLPRDAWQQAQEGRTIKKIKDAVCGDLAFFNDREEIVHVGILLNNEQIIHASGKVRIDAIDKKGIINSDTGKRTHFLESIKRRW